MSGVLPHLATAGLIASRLGVPLHRVQHILNTRPAIKPLALAGHTRLYPHSAIEQVQRELQWIEDNRARPAASEGRL